MMAEQDSREEHWANLISELRASGLSQVEFSRRRGICHRTLNNWLSKSPYRERAERVLAARAQSRSHVGPPKFVPVSLFATTRTIEPRAVSTPIEVVLQSGTRIMVTPGFDDETLRRVIATLEVRPC